MCNFTQANASQVIILIYVILFFLLLPQEHIVVIMIIIVFVDVGTLIQDQTNVRPYTTQHFRVFCVCNCKFDGFRLRKWHSWMERTIFRCSGFDIYWIDTFEFSCLGDSNCQNFPYLRVLAPLSNQIWQDTSVQVWGPTNLTPNSYI